mmetsp:Transcript_13468/g.18446  ORF Transcript_13468/g.18446 Transcript_13468/m.18446 type:complete len:285 (+) Transcript_13468:306-1160(+)
MTNLDRSGLAFMSAIHFSGMMYLPSSVSTTPGWKEYAVTPRPACPLRPLHLRSNSRIIKMFASFDSPYAPHRLYSLFWQFRSSSLRPSVANRCASEEVDTTLPPSLPQTEPALSWSSSRQVSRKWPRWLTPNCSSKPSRVYCCGLTAITPALFHSTSTSEPTEDAYARTLSREAKSTTPTPTTGFLPSARNVFLISSAAAAALPSLRHANVTAHPRRANSSAPALPIPVLEPVISTCGCLPCPSHTASDEAKPNPLPPRPRGVPNGPIKPRATAPPLNTALRLN